MEERCRTTAVVIMISVANVDVVLYDERAREA
jgi:hypothetical protein